MQTKNHHNLLPVWRIGLSLLLLILALITTSISHAAAPPTSSPQSQHISPGLVPDGLTSEEWHDLQTQITAAPYKPYASEQGAYVSTNPAQRWQISYTPNGTTQLTPQDATWQWGLRLTGYGYGREDLPVPALNAVKGWQNLTGLEPTLLAAGQTLTYQWDGNLSEWWHNDPAGLEQGFTLQTRPTQPQNQPLQLTLTIQGDLLARQVGQTITFRDESGAAAFTYDKLQVWDATGQTLPARFALHNTTLHILVDDTHATYPLTIDPLVQQAYLKASNTGTDDNFGYVVAASGDTVVVGTPYEDSNATGINGANNNSAPDAGAAYIFVRSGGSWTQQAYLKASNTEIYDYFGTAVAISGDTVVVTATGEDSNATGINGDQTNNSRFNSGAAYIFVRSGGSWSQQAYLKASNPDTDDAFGSAAAISGDTVVIGTTSEASNATGVNGNQADNSASASGAAYVFVRNGGSWSQQAYLKASNTETTDRFGHDVAVSGDTIVVGAQEEDSNATGINGNETDNSAANAGAAYVFVRSGGSWSQQAYLKASNTGADDEFGYTVSISGDTVVVGAHFENSNATGVNGTETDNSMNNAGAAYVFVRSGGSWSQQAYLKASNTAALDGFGRAIAISGDMVVVGATGEDSITTGVNGNQADNSASASGAAYVFVRSGGSWSQQAYLKASNTGAGDVFGNAVAISGNVVMVGARFEDSSATGVNGNQANNAATDAGAVYLYTSCLHSAQSGAWETTSTWVAGVAPVSTDGVCIDTGHTVTLNGNAAIDQLWVYPGGTLDLSTYSLTVEKTVANDGTLRQTQVVNNAAVEFLHLQNAALTQTNYRGVLVDSSGTAQNLGATTVTVRELNFAEYCTATGAGSPTYAHRCYQITPTNNQPATVRLYARTADELNGIAPANLSVFHNNSGWTELLTNRITGNDGGNYSYAQGDTPGFSHFLLGQTGANPTAITVQQVAGGVEQSLVLWGGVVLLLLLTGVVLISRPRTA
ncbi:MAG: hypothetical protein KA314_14110 [Chloroflexi bacterium]|nr:hypothetical protein [Chloroflexota bacterium]MBP8056968.1 hypothetical protein [Chloroflexota bacterium]